jgi:UDP-galactopyranose mutase
MGTDILVVGAGIFGLTIAERAASPGRNVLIIDKRNHVGGNAYSEFDQTTGIECHKYGAHLFHTSDERVWAYVNKFTRFTNYVHKVYTTHNGEVYPLPINLGTINQFFRNNYTPGEARELISKQAKGMSSAPQNLAEQGIALIGRDLFCAFIKNYTAKQWQTPAEELPPEGIKRLPVRYNYDNRYFNDSYEGLPVDGYAKLFQNMINAGNSGKGSIEVRLNTDYFEDAEIQKRRKAGIQTIFTGPIDRFYDYKFGELNWRSLDLRKEIVDTYDFQGCPVMNYADIDPKYTRIIEFKHLHPERALDSEKWPGYAVSYNRTVIVREYSKTWEKGGEPYYPVNTSMDRKKLAGYQELSKQDDNIIFGGRLGEYAYYDMDKTFAAALDLSDRLDVK